MRIQSRNLLIYFDTSAINWLFDDPRRDSILGRLVGNASIYISIFTVAELAATPSKERRTELLRLARKLSFNWRPLAWPGDLLKRSLDAFTARKDSIEGSMGAEWDGLWQALCNPEVIENEDWAEAVRWKDEQEQWYQRMHDEGREYIQHALSRIPANDREQFYKKPSRVLRYFYNNTEYITDLLSEMARRCGHETFSQGSIIRVLDLEEWRFFLGAMVYGFFLRSVQRDHFSKKRNPGSIDTMQAIYLSGCDSFVTADWNQYRMMKWLLPLGYRVRRIRYYDQLTRQY